MGRSCPSHLFIVSHLMINETARAAWNKTTFRRMKCKRMRDRCLQDGGVDRSSSCVRAFVWDFEGFHRVLEVPNGVPWRYVWLCLWEGRGRSSVPPVDIISSTSPFSEGLTLKIFNARFISGWRWRFHPT